MFAGFDLSFLDPILEVGARALKLALPIRDNILTVT
jgi:hypothetical protein